MNIMNDNQALINTSYDAFSHFPLEFSLKNLIDLWCLDFLMEILTFSCSESVFTFSSLIILGEAEVCKGNGDCWKDFLNLRGWTTAVATYPDVLNFWIFVASIVVVACMIGFLIFALELFVFLANCEMKSAVSTSFVNVLLENIYINIIIIFYFFKTLLIVNLTNVLPTLIFFLFFHCSPNFHWSSNHSYVLNF